MPLHIKPKLMFLNQRINQQLQMEWQPLLQPINLLCTSRLFHALFSTKEQKEGRAAFAEKRRAEWTHS
ncbi:hypothetical protein EDB19DRAFT_674105 [Suillus lakei]|nr:hypothetical protein EDB19DRAFT_674105 [Suillus lakei]